MTQQAGSTTDWGFVIQGNKKGLVKTHMYDPMTISNKQKLFFKQLLVSDKTNRHTYDRSLPTPADHCRSDGQVQSPGSGHTPEDQS